MTWRQLNQAIKCGAQALRHLLPPLVRYRLAGQ